MITSAQLNDAIVNSTTAVLLRQMPVSLYLSCTAERCLMFAPDILYMLKPWSVTAQVNNMRHHGGISSLRII